MSKTQTRKPHQSLQQKAEISVQQYCRETGIQCVLFDKNIEPVFPDLGLWSCHHYYCNNKTECLKDHQLVIQEANRLGNTFIHLCHKNFVLWGLPLVENGKVVGGAISGFVLFEQNRSQLADYQKDFPLLTGQNGLVSSKSVSLLSKRLFDFLKADKLIDVDLFKKSEEKAFIQREIGEKLIENKQERNETKHLVYVKQENLLNAIRLCDVDGIRDHLNDVLSEIFLEGITNLKLLKFRMLELFVLITRTMMEVGGNIDEFYDLTNEYAGKTENLEDIYSFSLWLKEVLNDFIDTVIAARKKLGHVNKAIEFIRRHLNKKLAISEVAAYVSMSESRFSQVFRQETGVSFPEYVNSLKIGKAKEMISLGNKSLTNIAAELCYYDQSYFTKTFRKHAGITPKQFLKKLQNQT